VEQELGIGWTEGVFQDDLARCLSVYRSAFNARKPFEIEYRLRRNDAEYRWVLDRGVPLYSAEGIFNGYIGSCVDITDLKLSEDALRVAQEQLQLVTNNMATAVARCTSDLRYTWVSPVYAQWLRKKPEEIAGRRIEDVIGVEGLEGIRPHIERVLAGEREEYEQRVTFQGLGARWIHAVYVPTKGDSDAVNGWIAAVTDISERKEMELERERSFEREREAREKAEEASRLKDEFLATISHELRTPLNAMLGWARLLQTGNLSAEETRQAIATIERNAKTQAQLIEDLLDVSRIITGKLRLNVRPVMMSTVIESAVASLMPTAEAKGITIQSMLDPDAGPVSGDAARLQQVFWNLLSNGIKFTPRGGRVQIRLERIDSHIEVTVSDTGEGISAEFLPYVFDHFRQEDGGTTRQHGGLGLGLSIVRQIVVLHGGTVTADSPGERKGSTFCVRLPLMVVQSRKDQGERVHPKAETKALLILDRPPNLHDVKVLLIDDDADTRTLLRTVLEQCGADVRDAASAEEGLNEAKKCKPSIVVSDIGMPTEDGYHFIEKFRAWERQTGRWTPAVALTAYARAEDRVRALKAGYQIHVAKPIEPVEFALVVAGQLGRGR
jgi:PAS domain S-box-containing protein